MSYDVELSGKPVKEKPMDPMSPEMFAHLRTQSRQVRRAYYRAHKHLFSSWDSFKNLLWNQGVKIKIGETPREDLQSKNYTEKLKSSLKGGETK